jgi:hypothetical protein
VRQRLKILLLATLVLGLSTGPALAYIDPGVGSIVLQSVIGAVSGALIVIRIYWAKIRGFFSKSSSDKAPLERRERK